MHFIWTMGLRGPEPAVIATDLLRYLRATNSHAVRNVIASAPMPKWVDEMAPTFMISNWVNQFIGLLPEGMTYEPKL